MFVKKPLNPMISLLSLRSLFSLFLSTFLWTSAFNLTYIFVFVILTVCPKLYSVHSTNFVSNSYLNLISLKRVSSTIILYFAQFCDENCSSAWVSIIRFLFVSLGSVFLLFLILIGSQKYQDSFLIPSRPFCWVIVLF